jgi:DNA-binding transcriptional LysR family regulator
MMIPDIDVALLKTFVAVVDSGSLTAAAKRVGRSQPAVTHQLKRLEQALNRALFSDNKRSLTRDGEILLGYARKLIGLNEEIRSRFSSPGLAGHVTLGTPDLYAAYLLPQILGRFARAHPDVEIELRCMRSVHLHEALMRDEIDIALMTAQPAFIEPQIVRQEPLVWVGPPDARPEQNARVPLALLPPGSVLRQRAIDALAAAGRSWTVVSISESRSGLKAAILAGLAVTVLPKCSAGSEMRRLAARDGFPPLAPVDLVIQQRAGSIETPAATLAKFIAAELRN